jgi:hypothetical protein
VFNRNDNTGKHALAICGVSRATYNVVVLICCDAFTLLEKKTRSEIHDGVNNNRPRLHIAPPLLFDVFPYFLLLLKMGENYQIAPSTVGYM